MTTSNFEASMPAQQDFNQQTSLLDIGQLSKLANEMFATLPCDGSRLGVATAAVPGGIPSLLANTEKSAIVDIPRQNDRLPGEAELQKLFAPRQQPIASVPDALDTSPVFSKPSSPALSPLAALDKSVLAGILPQDFGLPDQAQLQQLLVSRVPSGSTIPKSGEAGLSSAAASLPTDAEAVNKAAISAQVLEVELQKLFTNNTAVAENMSKTAIDNPVSTHGFSGFDASLIAGLTPEAFGLPGEAELLKLFAPAKKDSVNSEPGRSFYFLDEAGFNARAPEHVSAHPPFDVNAVRRDFPILNERVNGKQLIWFDNAATTQKPQAVIDRIAYFYQHENSNIHRAAHELAARATDAYEKARDTVAHFLNAPSAKDIVFVRGTTEGINLVAQSWGRQNLVAGDEIVITWLEHHANIVPWQQLTEVTGAKLRVAPVDDDGQLLLGEYQKLLNSRTKLVSFSHVSNALGTVTRAEEIIAMAHGVGARVLLDAAQSISHLPVDVQKLDCDWCVFSGHKVFAPTGIGALYGKAALLESMPPWQGGGNMIEDVTFEKIVYQPAPARFEAGTGNIADAVGLGAALEYLTKIGIYNVARYEHELLVYAIDQLKSISGLRLIGTAAEKTSVLSFVLEGHSNQDIGAALNQAGIAVRVGHHCAQPILRRFGLESTVRPSLAFYNTHEEVDRLVSTVRQINSGNYF